MYYGNFMHRYSNRNSIKGKTTANIPDALNHPKINSNSTPEQMKERALLVALGLVYYVRLNTAYRKKFADKLDKNNFSVKFQVVFTEEVHTNIVTTFIA